MKPPESVTHQFVSRTAAVTAGSHSTTIGIAVNVLLATIKGAAGILGNSNALLADAIESTADIFGSLAVLVGLKMASKPADANHPYGHGKLEPLAAVGVALFLFGAAIFIAVQSLHAIRNPEHAPAPFTLIVLAVVIFLKEGLFRFVIRVGEEVQSTAVKADAWHHRSDAITSAAAFIGITIALLGGPGYESADAFAALAAGAVIATNAAMILKPAIFELIDTAPDPDIANRIRTIAQTVSGVFGTHKCHVRKVGFDYYVDLDILCDPDASIRTGHEIAHNVVDTIRAELPFITKILVHVEPRDDYGRRSQEAI